MIDSQVMSYFVIMVVVVVFQIEEKEMMKLCLSDLLHVCHQHSKYHFLSLMFAVIQPFGSVLTCIVYVSTEYAVTHIWKWIHVPVVNKGKLRTEFFPMSLDEFPENVTYIHVTYVHVTCIRPHVQPTIPLDLTRQHDMKRIHVDQYGGVNENEYIRFHSYFFSTPTVTF